jgi:hypothetical protein
MEQLDDGLVARHLAIKNYYAAAVVIPKETKREGNTGIWNQRRQTIEKKGVCALNSQNE